MLRFRQALLGPVLAVEPAEELLFPAHKQVQDGINLIDLRGVVSVGLLVVVHCLELVLLLLV